MTQQIQRIVAGGTGQVTAQAAINALTAVAGASAGQVLTKAGADAAWSAFIFSGTAAQTYTFPTAGGTVALLNAANVFTTAQTITPGTSVTGLAINAAASAIGLVIKANATTPGNIQEWQNSSGTVLASISATGDLGIGTTATTRALSIYQSSATRTNGAQIVSIYAPSAGALVFQSAFNLNSQYNSTQTCTGFLSSFILQTSVTNSGAIPIRSLDILFSNTAAATVSDANTIYIRSMVNSGGGVITIARALYIEAQTAGATNYSIYTNAGLVHFGDSVDLAASKNISLSAGNIITDTTTGTKFGTATNQKLAFYNATPVVQQTELTDELTTITHTAPGTPDYAIQDLVQNTGFGFATADEGNTTLSVIANLQTRVNELETKLVAYGLLPDAD